MLITCPSCASEYVIDSALLRPNGRNVRCASCQTVFFAPPENPEPDPATFMPAEPEPDFEAFEIEEPVASDEEAPALAVEARTGRPETPRPAPRSAAGKRKAGALAALAARLSPARIPRGAIVAAALVVFVAAALSGRESVVRTLPQAAGLYALVGLEVNLRGLAIAEVVSVRVVEGAETFLVVEGVLQNVTRAPAEVPPLALSIRDRTQTSLYSWTLEPPRARLEPGERTSFRARLVAPPAEARQVLVTFVPASRATFARTGP